MAKARSRFICPELRGCPRIGGQGKCESCDEWNAIVEEGAMAPARSGGRRFSHSRPNHRSQTAFRDKPRIAESHYRHFPS